MHICYSNITMIITYIQRVHENGEHFVYNSVINVYLLIRYTKYELRYLGHSFFWCTIFLTCVFCACMTKLFFFF